MRCWSADSAKPVGLIRWIRTGRCWKPSRLERELLAPIRAMADHVLDTSQFTIHELRAARGPAVRGDSKRSICSFPL